MNDHPMDFVDADEIAETGQSALELFDIRENLGMQNKCNFATVDAVYGDRYTCDITTWNGTKSYNVPLLAKAYLTDDEIYGEFEMPVKGSVVLVGFIDGSESKPYIKGTVIPFLYPKYQSGQKAVNSDDKAFTLKLFEKGKEKYYRKIFQGGTTIEVDDKGTVTVELPSGAYIQATESGTKKIYFEDSFGNKVTLDTNGLTFEDAKGNTIASTATSLKINDNLEVLQ